MHTFRGALDFLRCSFLSAETHWPRLTLAHQRSCHLLHLALRLGNQRTVPHRRVNVFDISSFFSYPLIFARLSPSLSFLPRAVTCAIGRRRMTVQRQGRTWLSSIDGYSLACFYFRLQAFIFLPFIFLGFCALEWGWVFYLVGEKPDSRDREQDWVSSSLRHFTRDCDFFTSDIQGHSWFAHHSKGSEGSGDRTTGFQKCHGASSLSYSIQGSALSECGQLITS